MQHMVGDRATSALFSNSFSSEEVTSVANPKSESCATSPVEIEGDALGKEGSREGTVV